MSFERRRIHWRGWADGVAVLSFMPRFPHRLPMAGGDDEWWVDLHVPADSRIEYRLEIRRGQLIETTLDPANPHVASNPFGTNSVLTGREYSTAARCEAKWRIDEFRVPSQAFGGRRHHRLLSPADAAPHDPLPLVILHDGSDYLTHAGIGQVLACGMASGTLPPLRVALLDPRRRNVEYAADPRHAAHLALEVLPRLRNRVAVDEVVLAGASLGAVASWHTAWLHPVGFSGLVLQSGTFALGPHPEIPPPMAGALDAFLERALDDPRIGELAVAQTCGRYESLVDWNRAVAGRLGASSHSHRYREGWTGHDWGAWADTFLHSLAFVLRVPAPISDDGE